MIIDELKKLKDIGLYPCLVKGGVIPVKVNYYLEMYEQYNVRLVVNKNLNDCKMQSFNDVANDFNCSERTVINAVRFMEKNI